MANFIKFLAFWVLSCVVATAPVLTDNCKLFDQFLSDEPNLFIGKNLLLAFQMSKSYCESTMFTECKSMYYNKDDSTVRKMKVMRKLMVKQETEEQVAVVAGQFAEYAGSPYILQMKWCLYEGFVKDINEIKKYMNAFFGFEFYIQTFSSQPGKRSIVNYYREKLTILQRLKIWHQMAKGVEELHKKDKIHGSIRPEVFAVLKNDFTVVKMCDLGDAGSEGPLKSLSLQFFVPPEGFDRPDNRKKAFDVYGLTATFASLEMGFEALKNVQDFFQGAENSEKYNSMLCSAIIKEMEANYYSHLDAEQQTVLAKILTEGLKYDENARPPVEKIVNRIERLMTSLEKPAGEPAEPVEGPAKHAEAEEKVEELMKMATVIPDDLNQENDNQVVDDAPSKSDKPDSHVDGADVAEENKHAEIDTGDKSDPPAVEDGEAKEDTKDTVATEAKSPEKRPPIDVEDKVVVDTGDQKVAVQEKPMSPIFGEFIEKEKKKRNSKPSEIEAAEDNIDDFSDASNIADSYNNESPWAFFSVLIVGAFLISGSIFYWALD